MTEKLADLAIFGGVPAFCSPLLIGKPNLGSRTRFDEYLDGVFDRDWLTNDGPLQRELEGRIAELIGVRNVVAVANGTLALTLLMQAEEIEGEVILPSYTAIATPHAIYSPLIQPVFCDIDPATHNLDPRQVEKLVTSRTRAILGVHLWGRPCPVAELEQIAGVHGLKLYFDAAHAFACSYRGRMVGGFGVAETFSFHATKFFNTFEGGAIATNNDVLAEQLRRMRNFGKQSWDNVVSLGTNAKLDEVSAAMGLTLLDELDQLIEVYKSRYLQYTHALCSTTGIRVMPYDLDERCNYQYLVVEVDVGRAGLSAEELVQVLNAENIQARRYFYPACHAMSPYRELFPHASESLPVTEHVSRNTLCLPTGPSVSEADIAAITRIIQLVLDNSGVCRSILSARS